jgi:hypothetical protein
MIQKKVTKIFALTITMGVLITLIISAPAQAYILRLDVSDKTVNKGDKVSFTAAIQIQPKDKANITLIQLKLVGPLDRVCSFKQNGEIIEGCDGITIKKISSCSQYDGHSNGGYGYDNNIGYGYSPVNEGDCLPGYYSGNDDELKYNITYDT